MPTKLSNGDRKTITGQCMATSVFIIDDHQLFINGMKALINSFEGFSFAGYLTNTQGLEEKIANLSPDIVLLDLNLGTIDGLACIEPIKKATPHTKILVVTMYEENSLIREAQKLGADGFIIKNTDEKELLLALAELSADNGYWKLVPDKKNDPIKNLSQNQYSDSYIRLSQLTKREHEVFILLSQSYSTKEIASKLDMSENTVSTHRKHIKKKLEIKSSSGIVKVAFENGLL